MGDMKRMCSWTTREPCLVCACVPIFEVVKGTLACAIHLLDTHLHESLLVRRSECYVLFEEIIPSHGELFSCQGKLSTCVSTLQGFITRTPEQIRVVGWDGVESSYFNEVGIIIHGRLCTHNFTSIPSPDWALRKNKQQNVRGWVTFRRRD